MGKVKFSRVCVLCKKDINDELKFGPLKTTKLMLVHYYCLLLSETISQSGQDDEGILGFMASDIVKELSRTKNQKCCYCNTSPATLGCSHNHCNRKFHLYCGYKNNAVFNFEKFNARCNIHTKPSNVPAYIKKSITDYHCLICLEVFDSQTKVSDVIWANCCKSNVILHSDCIRQMALSAGYFTKCPGCNNNTTFINTIKSWGVFVPERDASWELDRNAFSELLYVHSKCDQTDCSCPNGREHSEEYGKWKLMLCKMCGSVGAHMKCVGLKRRFICDVCSLNNPTPISNEKSESNDPEIIDLTTTEEEDGDDMIEIEVLDVPDDEKDNFHNDKEVEIIDNFNVHMQMNDELHDLNKNTPRKKKKGQLEERVKSPHKKRPLEVISNIDRNEENMMASKKIRNDMDHFEINDKIADYHHKLTETLMVEKPSQSFIVMLDDDNEVEFISGSDVNSSSSGSDNVDLFLNKVRSKSQFNKENQNNCNILQNHDAQEYISEHGSKSDRVLELNFRSYTHAHFNSERFSVS